MRHGKSGRKLARTSSHRQAMLRNLVTSFLKHERIVTTVAKAKEMRRIAEKMITFGKKETLHARRQALKVVRDKAVVAKLFDTLAPRFADRPGGYTRIIKIGTRHGDNAEMAIVELLGSELEVLKAKKKDKDKTEKGKTTFKEKISEMKSRAKRKKKGAVKGKSASKPKDSTSETKAKSTETKGTKDKKVKSKSSKAKAAKTKTSK
jgi:large subunit ribosomal protein L17